MTNKEKVRREIQKNSLSKNDYDNETNKHTIRQTGPLQKENNHDVPEYGILFTKMYQ